MKFSSVCELIVNMFCVLLKLFSGLFLILVIVDKLQIARCNRELGNTGTCIEQLKEMRRVEETSMPDSHYRLCQGQYSSVSVSVLFYSTALTFIYIMQ